MLIVLDTNILVSALLSPFGPPARILDMVLRGDFRVAYDDRLLAEYRAVLARPKFGFAADDVTVLLEYLEMSGEFVVATPLLCPLPDPDDLPFLEVAIYAHAVLITGNIAHYLPHARGNAQVMTPVDFLRIWCD